MCYQLNSLLKFRKMSVNSLVALFFSVKLAGVLTCSQLVLLLYYVKYLNSRIFLGKMFADILLFKGFFFFLLVAA